eukprot:Opistho-2@91987
MRSVPAMLNALVVPLAFLTMTEWGFSMSGSVVAGVLVLFENSFVTQSRFILLDSMLIFFVATSVYCWATFCNLRTRAFSRQWWMWLLLLGASLSCALSVKWVGLFVIALIGVHTLLDLWRLIGDQKLSILDLVAHFMARVACLIIVPIVGYIFFLLYPLFHTHRQWAGQCFHELRLCVWTPRGRQIEHLGTHFRLTGHTATPWHKRLSTLALAPVSCGEHAAADDCVWVQGPQQLVAVAAPAKRTEQHGPVDQNRRHGNDRARGDREGRVHARLPTTCLQAGRSAASVRGERQRRRRT